MTYNCAGSKRIGMQDAPAARETVVGRGQAQGADLDDDRAAQRHALVAAQHGPGAVGISRTRVHRLWAEAGLKPHLTRSFKVSNDPKFEEKFTDFDGHYMNPPEKVLVL